MTDEPALIAAVCDRPDDDTPRKVYADWCDDQGDPGLAARAAFIRAQVKLAEAGGRVPSPGEFQCRKPKTRPVYAHDYGSAPIGRVYVGPCGKCDWCALTREAAEAFAAMPAKQKHMHGEEYDAGGRYDWLVDLNDIAQWRRGFPEVVRRTHSVFWRTHHAAILAAAPIRRVELVDVPEVTFGGIRSSIVDHPDGGADLIDEWDVTWGQHTARCVSKTTLAPEVMRAPNEPAAAAVRQQHLDRTFNARTTLGFFAMKWPKVEFVLPPQEPDYRGYLRQMDDEILRSLGIPPALVRPDPRAFIRPTV